MSAPARAGAAVLSLHVNPTGELLEAARECEAEIFQRWYGNSRRQLDAEYGPYEHATAFIVLCREGDGGTMVVDGLEVVGVTRVIRPNSRGLKTFTDVALPPWEVDPDRASRAAGLDPATTWEVATIGVRSGRGLAGRQCAAALYHGLVLAGRVNDVHALVAVLDEKVRGMLEAAGLGMQALPGTKPMPYLGSAASTPVFGELAAMLSRQRRHSPEAYRLVTLGVGLSGVTVPPPEAFLLPVPAISVTAGCADRVTVVLPQQRRIDLRSSRSAGGLVEEPAARG